LEKQSLTISHKRWLYGFWLILVCSFALLHAFHLSADFPNHTPWFMDWAKYTDEGWYGNAAVRAHLFGNWYMPGDFNPAPAVPVWPFLEWMLFFFTGVSIQAARGLAVAFFFCNLLLSYLLLRAKSPRWVALTALTLLVTSPFLYCFSRLAILEPMLIAFTLTALNLAVRLPRLRRPIWASITIGLLFTLMMLTKTTAVFLLPALGWAMLLPLWHNRKLAARCVFAAVTAFVASFGLWMALVIHLGLLADFKYLFFINKYDKPPEFYWPVLSFWWSFHGGLWVDHILIPLAFVVIVGTILAGAAHELRRRAAGKLADESSSVGWSALLLDPVFGASVLAIAGYILFMTYQNHPQPRYFAVVAFFSFFVVTQGAGALLGQSVARGVWPRRLGWAVVALAAVAAISNSIQTLSYAAHPEYTFVTAAQRLTSYIDAHPNGRRLLVSISGDQITMISHLPTLCDDFGTPSPQYPDLVTKLNRYQPGWWATWNDIDPGTLEDLHTHFSLEQVASFRALDDSDRNVLVLFKLRPLPGDKARDSEKQNLGVSLPGDKIDIPVE
jgi:4-amino-4-deoxy-L-arabinose transferase-like glycosyltransferase